MTAVLAEDTVALVERTVDRFYSRVLRDPVLSSFFTGVDLPALKRRQTELFVAILGGAPYTGRPLGEARAGYAIEQRHFDRVAKYLVEAMRETQVPPAVQQQLLEAAAKVAPSIVNTPDKLAGLRAAVAPHEQAVITHPLFQRLTTVEALRVFTEYHVYAVWDFMTLLKALQRVLTCVEVPWVPRGECESRRLINEIVLGEETDVDLLGRSISHYELYLVAMEELGADTGPVRAFVENIEQGHLLHVAMQQARVPKAAQAFVLQTVDTVHQGRAHCIAASFTIGREKVIPDMFGAFIDQLHAVEPAATRTLRYYVQRHIDVDADTHAPLALRMLENLCGNDPAKWHESTGAAIAALRARHDLWSAIAAELPR